MRWIDFQHRTPMESISGWVGWTRQQWDAWLEEADILLGEVACLNLEAEALCAAGHLQQANDKIKERNKYIDDHSSHWGKLKPWLFALSHGKCWFTEGRDICSHADVEHFRPKKEARGIDDAARDGYWWLAFDYRNFRASGNVPNRKKGGWFPLHKDSPCSRFTARCEESETYYLLDPVRQTDVALLAFDEEGKAIPRPGANKWEKDRVMESIMRLKLNEHEALAEERVRVWQTVSREIDAYLDAKSRYRPGINPAPRETMEEKARHIRQMTREEAELSAVAAWCVRFRNEADLLPLIL